MKFKTKTGSIYEINDVTNQVRRADGKAKPADRIRNEWRDIKHHTPVIEGQPVIILYPDSVPLLPGSPPEAEPGTITSPVAEILAC